MPSSSRAIKRNRSWFRVVFISSLSPPLKVPVKGLPMSKESPEGLLARQLFGTLVQCWFNASLLCRRSGLFGWPSEMHSSMQSSEANRGKCLVTPVYGLSDVFSSQGHVRRDLRRPLEGDLLCFCGLGPRSKGAHDVGSQGRKATTESLGASFQARRSTTQPPPCQTQNPLLRCTCRYLETSIDELHRLTLNFLVWRVGL